MFTRFSFRSVAVAVLGVVGLVSLARGDNPAVTVAVDASANRHAINPDVYGVAFTDSNTLKDLNVPLHRHGGNATTAYNWQLNCDNRGNDWYFESIPGPNIPADASDSFINTSKAGNAEAMITIPMVDWVAKVGPNREKLAAFSIAKYGAQTGNDASWFPDAGNGILASDGSYVVNDPNDAFVPNTVTFQRGWVEHIVNRYGTAANGGLKYYILDNEHSIWQGTHRSIQPVGANMETIRDKMIAWGTMIKEVDPTAKVVGPEEWGWSGYLYSGYDLQWGGTHGWGGPLPDRTAHGNWDYVPWLLKEIQAHETATGQRVLDVFTLHIYPQRGEFSNDVSTSMQLIRNETTRELWDPSYRSQSWINDYVKLIPRMKQWVNTYHPNTPIGITEYNWGAEGHINGATTQADIYGIFGRENLDMAARWTTPGASTPTYKAMKMYRNYDGYKSTFGDTSVSASVPNPDQVAAFAAERTSDGAMTVMVISKYLTGNTPVTISVSNFAPGAVARVWQLTSANTITQLSDVAVNSGQVFAVLPPQSITLFVVPGGDGLTLPAGWSCMDIGGPTPPGSSGEASGLFTIKGGGADIGGSSDQFHFAFKDISGDSTVLANCDTLENTNGWAKGGVMFRDGTAADAMFAAVTVTPANGVVFQYRTTTGGSADSAQATGQAVPKYVKLQRTGNSFAGYYSADGSTWTQVGTAQTIAMPAAMKAGLAVTSHAQGTLTTATFNGVSVYAAAPPPPPLYFIYQESLASGWQNWSWSSSNNFSATGQAKDSTYSISTTYTGGWGGLSLYNGTAINTTGYAGFKLWVYGGDSNKQLNLYTEADGVGGTPGFGFTAVANTWTEITIPFSALGNPARVNRFTIQNASANAQSIIYFDDIRVYPAPPNQPPSDITLSANTVRENQAAGTVVGTLATVDPDAGQTFAYALVSGIGGNDNSSFQIIGNELRTAASFNYEVRSSYSIRIRTTDSGAGNLSYDKVFTISVLNTVEQAPVITGISNDTGAAGDGITSDRTLVISGTAEAGVAIQVFRGGAAAGTTASASDGAWTLDYTGTSLTDGTYSFTATASDAFGGTSAASSAYIVKVDGTAPAVSSVTVNTGAAQRSMVTGLTVLFSEPVSLQDGAIAVKLHSGGDVANVTTTVTPQADGRSFVLSFSGLAVTGSSLPDGIYDLVVTAAKVGDPAGNAIASNYTFTFHRLFGDDDGNKVVNASDYTALRNTFDKHSTDAGFNAAFDYENNLVINASDLTQFRKRFNVRYTY